MPIIDELITILGFDADTSGADLFNSALGGLKSTATAVGTALLAAEAAVVAYTNKAAAAATETLRFSESFGVSSDRLQQFEFAAKIAGGTAEGLRADIASLTKSLASPIPGQFNQGLFLLGINVRKSSGEIKSADEVLLNLADRFAGLSDSQAQILASQAGLSEGTLRFVRQGRAEIERLGSLATSLGGVIPPEALKSAENYSKKLEEVRMIVGGVGQRISASLLPAMTSVLQSTEDWVLANKEVLQQKIKEFAEGLAEGLATVSRAVSAAVTWLRNLSPGLSEAAGKIDLVRLAASAVIAVVGALALAFAPAIAAAAAWTAGVAAAALVVDDLISLASGGDSVIGSMFDKIIEKFPQVQGIIDRVSDLFGRLVDGIGPLVSAISLMFEGTGDSATVLGTIVDGVGALIIRVFDGALMAIETVIDIFTVLIALFSGDFSTALDIASSRVGKIFEYISSGISGAIDWVSRLIESITSVTGIAEKVKNSLDFGLIDAGKGIAEKIGGFFGGKPEGESPQPVKEKITEKNTENVISREKGPEAREPERKPAVQPAAQPQPARIATREITAPQQAQVQASAGGTAPEWLRTLSDIGNSITSAISSFAQGQIEAIRSFDPVNTVMPVTARTSNYQTSNQQVKGGDTTVTNVYNINGAQSPQAVAQAIGAYQGRRQASLATAAQVGAYPGME